jgi:hypothetical protein
VDLGGVVLKSWPVFTPFLEADKIINLPIAKHHGLVGATLGMKNWYGILGGQRNRLHQQIHQSLADLANFMLPTVTLMDCYRILLRNGPTGGNLEDVAPEEDRGGGNRSCGARRLRCQGVLEPGPRAPALSADGCRTRSGHREVTGSANWASYF